MPDSSSLHLGPSLLPRYRICGLRAYAAGACTLQWGLYRARAVTERLTPVDAPVNGRARQRRSSARRVKESSGARLFLQVPNDVAGHIHAGGRFDALQPRR